MCTLIALHRCVAGASLLVAANRDEYLDRPAEGPALRSTPAGPIVSPLDLRAGGTWFGLNPKGVFVALTNRPVAEPDPDARSRGHVPIDALRAGTAAEAAELLGAIPSGIHNPFNAFVADSESAFALVYEKDGRSIELEPGAHVVGNAEPDSRLDPKVGRVLAESESAAKLPLDEATRELQRICRAHDCGGPRRGLDDTCVHMGAYGTRSSFVLSLGTEPGAGADRFLYADGPPCDTEYSDFTALLSELTQWASYGDGEPQARALP